MLDLCDGSLGEPLERGEPDEFGCCPICGSTLVLGYGGLLPPHHAPRPPDLRGTGE